MMKNLKTLLVVFILSLLFSGQAFTQKTTTNNTLDLLPTNCPMSVTPAELQAIVERDKSRPTSNTSNLKFTRDVPIQVHIVRRTNGTGGVSEASVMTDITDANNLYASAGFNFYKCGPTNFINNNNFFNNNIVLSYNGNSREYLMANANKIPGVLNVFYVPNVSPSNTSWSSFPSMKQTSGKDWIIMWNGHASTNGIFAHEVGHWFDLFHTHQGSENVTRNSTSSCFNCTTNGDLLCDTPADANDGFTANCTYNGSGTDACGASYSPLTNNIMSYAFGCLNAFTPGQINRMKNAYDFDRTDIHNPTNCTPCIDRIISFPHKESFEYPWWSLEWQEDTFDDMDWTKTSQSTPSSSTGPSAAQHGYYFKHIEASGNNSPNKTANLVTRCISMDDMDNKQIIFYYHMFGEHMGTLNLQVSTNYGSTWTTIWSESGPQINFWKKAVVGLAQFSGDIQIRFNGITGNSFRGDMAIDNIVIGGPDECWATVVNYPYSESFETDFGWWTQGAGEDTDWVRNSGGTPSSATGPSGSSNGNFYAYIEASGPNRPNKIANLNSPCLYVDATPKSLLFHYHMYGSGMGTLALDITVDGGVTWTTLWSRSGNQGNSWKIGVVDLSNYYNGTIQLRFHGTTGTTFRSDMAIDNIHILNHLNSGARMNKERVEIEQPAIQLKNYPNPFQNTTTIEYTLEADATATLTITDIAGKIVARPFQEELKQKGTHKFEFQASELPPGLYFYSLVSEGERVTKQMLIFK